MEGHGLELGVRISSQTFKHQIRFKGTIKKNSSKNESAKT